MRRCQRIDETSSGSSPGLGGRFPEGGGRRTVGLRAEALMAEFRKANSVSEGGDPVRPDIPVYTCLGQHGVL